MGCWIVAVWDFEVFASDTLGHRDFLCEGPGTLLPAEELCELEFAAGSEGPGTAVLTAEIQGPRLGRGVCFSHKRMKAV